MCIVSDQLSQHEKNEAEVEAEQNQERLEELVNKFDELTIEYVKNLDEFEQDFIELDKRLEANDLKKYIQKFNNELPEI